MNIFSLSHDLFRNLNFDSYERDFTFFVGSKEFKCNRIIADLISPKVKQNHQIDPTLDSFNVSDECDFEDDFEMIISLGEGKSINTDEIDYNNLEILFNSIGNHEFSNFIHKSLNSINITNAIYILKKRISLSLSYYNEVVFIASHFYLFTYNELSTLDEYILMEILSHQNLVIESEEWLFKFILQLTKTDPKYAVLFQFIDFANISTECIVEFTRNVSFEDLNASIWKSIIKRLTCDIEILPVPPAHRFVNKTVKIHYKPKKPMNGIISYLTNECGENVSKAGIVEVSASSTISSLQCYSPASVTDFKSDDYFFSLNIPNQWIMYHFKDHIITPTSYSIKSNCDGTNGNHPKEWIFEGSEDGIKWKELDSQINNNSLNGRYIIANFPIKKHVKCKYLRFKQTGKNWNQSFDLIITGMEIFGIIKNQSRNDK
ncbi:hypothetical protein TRFO_13030 [Tritrichomonas foetus]|uniref:F5/8 type C domain-containing protein n=1 Tax=Tritrichomonas foetus TaxID=1144522 RepID=A0A1J4KZE2_9EUKA|nr:hypothetical protein TRFO_13030 [Tritrichomonas foetus]|eukprot:OHT16619.1 hypothetical protein TRFO_13030 [Tritrichomonas foetus]